MFLALRGDDCCKPPPGCPRSDGCGDEGQPPASIEESEGAADGLHTPTGSKPRPCTTAVFGLGGHRSAAPAPRHVLLLDQMDEASQGNDGALVRGARAGSVLPPAGCLKISFDQTLSSPETLHPSDDAGSCWGSTGLQAQPSSLPTGADRPGGARPAG